MFATGRKYERKDIQLELGLPPTKGDWYTGHRRQGNDHYLFCGIGVAGTTGHDYQNRFEGNELIWHPHGKANLKQPKFSHLVSGKGTVHVFYRHEKRGPFEYAGPGKVLSVTGDGPLEVRWSFEDQQTHPDEIPPTGKVKEGARMQVTVNAYERDPTARWRCIRRWGTICQVCRFDFEARYGERGKGFIHVHHLRPLASIGQEYELHPEEDLRPVCPNCHAMLHRSKDALSIEQLRSLLKQQPQNHDGPSAA